MAIIPRLIILIPLLWKRDRPLTGDSLGYWTLAQNLLHHGVFSLSSSPPYAAETFRTPGYPFFLVPFAAAFRSPLIPVAGAQCLIGVLTVLIAWSWLE